MGFTIALLLASATVHRSDIPEPKVLAPLQGTWTITSVERGGAWITQDELAGIKEGVLVVTGNKAVVSFANGGERNYLIEGDLSKRPQTVNLYSTKTIGIGREGDRVVTREFTGKFLDHIGIFTVEGKTLKLCLSQDCDDRPAKFVTAGRPRFELFILNRKE